MSTTGNIESRSKKELETKEESTVPGKYYLPDTDIYETEQALTVVMEIPGINKDAIDIHLEKDELSVRAEVDLANYDNYQPAYTEYNVGHFKRRFSLSNKVDQDKIEANVENGVLFLTLPKAEEAKPKKVVIN